MYSDATLIEKNRSKNKQDIMYALIDPNWGDPVVIPQTMRRTEDEAWAAGISPKHCSDIKIYSGASEHPYPHGTPGKISTLKTYGFFVRPVTVKINFLEE